MSVRRTQQRKLTRCRRLQSPAPGKQFRVLGQNHRCAGPSGPRFCDCWRCSLQIQALVPAGRARPRAACEHPSLPPFWASPGQGHYSLFVPGTISTLSHCPHSRLRGLITKTQPTGPITAHQLTSETVSSLFTSPEHDHPSQQTGPTPLTLGLAPRSDSGRGAVVAVGRHLGIG